MKSLGLHRIHLSLTQEQFRFLQAEAFERHTTVSQVNRDLVEEARRRALRRGTTEGAAPTRRRPT
jgi:hypothetical protein